MKNELSKEELRKCTEAFFDSMCRTYCYLLVNVDDLLRIYKNNPTSILNLRIREECKIIDEGIIEIIIFVNKLYSGAIMNSFINDWNNKRNEISTLIDTLEKEYKDLTMNEGNKNSGKK